MSALLAIALAHTPALAAPQLKVRAALLVEGAPETPRPVVASTRTDTLALLQGSGRYLVLDDVVVEARTGLEPAALAGRCGEDAACWGALTQELAVDQLLVLEVAGSAEAPTGHLRVWDAATPDAPRGYLSTLPRGGGAPIDILEDAFFADGGLLVNAPVGVRMSLDGESLGEVGGALSLPKVEGGKHTLGMEDPQGGQHLLVVQVVPGRTTQVDFQPPPPALVRRRWGPWAGAGMVAFAVAWFVVARDAPGTAQPV
ncbi:MAG: hypothetical protein VX899_27110 [Myxococcota bacterium]|nr:hypothetical protein [Myxococcota bacterium]